MSQILTRAHDELYRRTPDERFATMQDLWDSCQARKQRSELLWRSADDLLAIPRERRLELATTPIDSHRMNSWSFGQLCGIAGVNRDTVNRLTPQTAAKVFEETMPRGGKPMQLYADGDLIRSIHGASYTRLHDVELLTMLKEFATDFVPPQESGAPGSSGGSGLYCGEQDMFCFLIDPTGWTEINGEAFAPGFFIWNSEVGKRSVGVQTFWFQAVCRNHIVWDAVEVVEFSRKHTANVHDSLRDIRRIVEALVEKRDQRRDGFVAAIKKAMVVRLGDDAEEVMKVLTKHGITRQLSKEALELAREQGAFTIFSVVDALTKIAGRLKNAGDRSEVDQKASSLLALAR
jgi:hypothetical protein